MSQDILPYQEAIASSKTKFVGIANSEKAYDVESMFAMQMLMKNDFSMKTANNNPRSVRLAMINVASTGLTLNPANGYAYLVPRDGAIVLDISYKGLIKIATDAGSVEWARADLVYSADEFVYSGPAVIPQHKANPFSGNRGEVIGAYCIAKTHSGDILTEVMDLAEIEKIRSKSTAWVKGQQGRKGPWEEWFDQMAKKAIIKRASKTWPYTDRSERLGQAIEIANESEGGYTLGDLDAEEKAYRRQQTHDAALGRWFKAITAIKDHLDVDEPDMYAVAEIWGQIPQDDQMALWLAPAKGGIFTTRERQLIKSDQPKREAIEHNHEGE